MITYGLECFDPTPYEPQFVGQAMFRADDLERICDSAGLDLFQYVETGHAGGPRPVPALEILEWAKRLVLIVEGYEGEDGGERGYVPNSVELFMKRGGSDSLKGDET